MPRKERVKAAESTDGLFADVLVMEREAGRGHRDRVKRGNIWYERFRISIINAKGVKERITIYGKTSAELTRKVKERLATPARTADTAKMSVEDYFVDLFLPGAKSSVRPNTYASYENAVNTRIIPGIGKAKFAALTADNVRVWIGEMKEASAGARSDQLGVTILKRGYKRALSDGLLNVDPIGHVKVPRVIAREQYILSRKETVHFLRTLRLSKTESEWFPLIYCAISLGMREGEMFGLMADKVDLEGKRIKVFEQAGPLADGKTVGQVPLKTDSSTRTLYLDDQTIRALAMRKDQANRLVFANPKGGGYLKKRTMSATIFPRLLKEAGLPTDGRIWFHLLRHVASSLLSSADVSTPKIDKWMGHTVSGIAGKYIKIHDEDMEKIAEVMSGILSPVWA